MGTVRYVRGLSHPQARYPLGFSPTLGVASPSSVAVVLGSGVSVDNPEISSLAGAHFFDHYLKTTNTGADEVYGEYMHLQSGGVGTGCVYTKGAVAKSVSGGYVAELGACYYKSQLSGGTVTGQNYVGFFEYIVDSGVANMPSGGCIQLDDVVSGALNAVHGYIAIRTYGTYPFSNLLNIMDHTSGTGKLWYGSTLKLRIGTTPYYLPLSTAENSLTLSGNYLNGILFTGQVVLTGANRNASYFGIGSYGSHITVNRASQNESSRTYLMQAFVDFAADTAASSDYAMVFYPRINVTTANQTKSSFAVLSPTIDINYNIKNGYALKAEMDASDAHFTAVTENLNAISGFLDLGTETKNFDCSGTSGACAVRADFAGGGSVTLQGTSRTFALCANVYTGAVATGVASFRVDGSGAVTYGAIFECGATAAMPHVLRFNAMGGMTYLLSLESVAGFLSASATALNGVTSSHKIAVRISDSITAYIPVVTDGMS